MQQAEPHREGPVSECPTRHNDKAVMPNTSGSPLFRTHFRTFPQQAHQRDDAVPTTHGQHFFGRTRKGGRQTDAPGRGPAHAPTVRRGCPQRQQVCPQLGPWRAGGQGLPLAPAFGHRCACPELAPADQLHQVEGLPVGLAAGVPCKSFKARYCLRWLCAYA